MRAASLRRRWALVAVVAMLVLVGGPVAGADPTPFDPDPRYSPQLSSRIVVYNNAVAELGIKLNDLKQRTDDLMRRVDDHNAAVDAYPNRTAPPAVARRLNAEADRLRAEQQQLRAELDTLKAELTRLDGERAAIAAAARAELNALIQADPPPHTAPQPGNQYQRLPPPKPPVRPQAQDGGNPGYRSR